MFESLFFKTDHIYDRYGNFITMYNDIVGQYLDRNIKTKCKHRTHEPFWNNTLKLIAKTESLN